jgi:membrane associated rhomboid family serine protease
MAGRFSFSVPERRNFGDPWFRIGQLEVTTTVLVVLLCVASMFVWAADREIILDLVLFPDLVREGEVWRVVTWPLANEPDIWTVLAIAIFWYFGREIEGLLGRVKFAVFLLVITVVPGLVATALDLEPTLRLIAGIRPIEFAVFLVFIAEYPFARFFFGIPAWAIGAIFLGIEVLRSLGWRDSDGIVLLFVGLATAAITARSMGLLSSLPWVPAIPIGRGSSGRRHHGRSPKRRRGGGEVVAGPWPSSRAGPSRSSRLPQPPPPPAYNADQAELDALLDKISEKGMDGLTSDEKKRLNELSKRMRNRK